MSDSDMIDDATYDIIRVYLAQMHSAVKISEIICEHSEREELTGSDIICGLIYRLMIPMSDNEIQECMASADEILEDDIDDIDDEILDDGEDDRDDENIQEEDVVKGWIKVKSNNCNCDICCQARISLLNYKDYEAQDVLASRFNNSIKETCEKFKLII